MSTSAASESGTGRPAVPGTGGPSGPGTGGPDGPGRGGPVPPARTRPPWWAATSRPVWTAVALAAVSVVVSVVVAGIGDVASPDPDPTTARLVAVLVMVVLAVAVVVPARAWSRLGARGPASWSHLGLLAVPALLALAPLVTGLDLPEPSFLLVLVVGYAATGVFEELWHRGVIQDTLRPCGLRRAAVVGGVLFGASHLANIAFGQPVAVSLAQAVGAFCFGFGYAVLRWRTSAVWLLVVIHAVGDLMFQITNLDGAALWGFLVGHDVVVLLWGLWCLRGTANDLTARPAAKDGAA